MAKNRILASCLIGLAGISSCPQAIAVSALRPSTSWMRLDNNITHLKLSPKGALAAYLGPDGKNLQVLDLKTRKIYPVTNQFVGSSFFWSPDGFRLVYREMGRSGGKAIESIVKAYDCKLNTSVVLERYDHRTGFLTFDPRDRRFYLMHSAGIHTLHLEYPDIRLARWQRAQKENFGKWLVAQNGILWVSQGGFAMERMNDDGSPVESFDVSPDGKSIAWATEKGLVYTSRDGEAAKTVGPGRDPSWHRVQGILIYAGAHLVGQKVTDYDLRIIDQNGVGRWITDTQHSAERWPQWQTTGTAIVFTKDKTTDLYVLDVHL